MFYYENLELYGTLQLNIQWTAVTALNTDMDLQPPMYIFLRNYNTDVGKLWQGKTLVNLVNHKLLPRFSTLPDMSKLYSVNLLTLSYSPNFPCQ